jgi:pimeloyl-ACP methyl ester carboxylesterase
MPEFAGPHAGLCRTLLTQMSEFAGSIKSPASRRVAPLQRRMPAESQQPGGRQRRWLPYALTIMADTAILDGAANQVKVPTLIAGGAKSPDSPREAVERVVAFSARLTEPQRAAATYAARSSLPGSPPNAGRHPRAGPSCCQVTEIEIGQSDWARARTWRQHP